MNFRVLAEDEQAGQQKHQRNRDQRRQRIGKHQAVKGKMIFVEQMRAKPVRPEEGQIADANHQREAQPLAPGRCRAHGKIHQREFGQGVAEAVQSFDRLRAARRAVEQVAQIGRRREDHAPDQQGPQIKAAAQDAVTESGQHAANTGVQLQKTLGLRIEVQLVLLLVEECRRKARRDVEQRPSDPRLPTSSAR
jgi:hypothetical protein